MSRTQFEAGFARLSPEDRCRVLASLFTRLAALETQAAEHVDETQEEIDQAAIDATARELLEGIDL
jgi:hypothetical protein